MRSSWQPDEAELDAYARGAIFYEITTLAQQASVLLDRHLKRVPHGVETNALIEAALIHLRLLDDFLGSNRQTEPPGSRPPDDVFACHWLPAWQPQSFLTAVERRDIHAHVAHLSARRAKPEWLIVDMAQRCLAEFARFVAQLRVEFPTRASSFQPILDAINNAA